MKIKYIVFALLLCSVFNVVLAQMPTDALRYAQLQLGSGTARTMGVGGSIGALGGDFSSLSTNPAGLATFRRSEFSLSPAFFTNTTTSTLVSKENIKVSTDASKLTLNSWGFVFAYRPKSGNSDWKTFNLGFGKNRLNNLDEEFSFEGRSKGTIVESFTDQAQGFTDNKLNPFSTSLAYSTGAIFKKKGAAPTVYTNDFVGLSDKLIKKSQYVLNEGKITEFVVSLAGNYKEKIQIGGSIAFPRATFNSYKGYEEKDLENENMAFNGLKFKDSLQVNTPAGKSITAKFGAIYKLSQSLRVGVALHSPTSWSITEQYNNSMTYAYTEAGVDNEYKDSSPDGLYSYKVVTPARVIGSLGYIIGQKGFLSAEVEYVDYTKLRFKFSDIGDKPFETTLNNQIKTQFKAGINTRLGAEIVLGSVDRAKTEDDGSVTRTTAQGVFRLRGGIGLYSNPLRADNSVAKVYSFGLGFREDNFFIDLAGQLGRNQTGYTPYTTTSGAAQQVNNDSKTMHYVMTVGFKF